MRIRKKIQEVLRQEVSRAGLLFDSLDRGGGGIGPRQVECGWAGTSSDAARTKNMSADTKQGTESVDAPLYGIGLLSSV